MPDQSYFTRQPGGDRIFSVEAPKIKFGNGVLKELGQDAETLGMKVKSVRLFFIYASFTTIIGGFLLYLTIAFWLKMKDMIYTKRSSVFDL